MEIEEKYEVVNIYRNYEPILSFTLALFRDELIYRRVDRSQSDLLARGYVFIWDFVKIIEKTSDGIVIALTNGKHDPRAVEPISLLHADTLLRLKILSDTRTRNFLPFLCDVLPYSKGVEIKSTRADASKDGRFVLDGKMVCLLQNPLPQTFIAKIYQKTRISMYPNTFNPFFFVIAYSNGIFVKIVFWREVLKMYSSLSVGDIICVQDYKNKKKLPFIDKIDCNTFTESVYFDCPEITVRELVKVDSGVVTVEEIIHSFPDNDTTRFHSLSGTVEYTSILLRYNLSHSLMEYILCKVDGQSVVLFYNSDETFYSIKEGSKITITELRKVKRGRAEFFVSTIYTQFILLGSEDVIHKKAKTEENRRAIFGAVGYIPDSFQSTSEIQSPSCTEKIRGKDVVVGLFVRPNIITIEELSSLRLFINETRKVIVYVKILDVGSNGTAVEYTENGIPMKQLSTKVSLEGGLACHLFDNFFINDNTLSLSLISEKIGKKVFVAIDALRISVEMVLYIFTGILDE